MGDPTAGDPGDSTDGVERRRVQLNLPGLARGLDEERSLRCAAIRWRRRWRPRVPAQDPLEGEVPGGRRGVEEVRKKRLVRFLREIHRLGVFGRGE